MALPRVAIEPRNSVPTGAGWRLVPPDANAQRWLTVPVERSVLAVARNITSTAWLLELLPDLLSDRRVQIVFSVPRRSSVFDPGLDELLAEHALPVIPWDQALSTRFDLAISASHNGDLHELSAPLLVVPHGAGYSKHTSLPIISSFPIPTGAAAQGPTGIHLSSTTALSHGDQAAQFEAAGEDHTTVVVGDPCFDQLVASVADQDDQKRSMGLKPHQKLILLSSTWGPHSLFARHPDLAAKALSQLAFDEYRVALVLHPNIWSGHGPWQIRQWLREEVAGGLILVPPTPADAWRAAVIAADLIVGDHGSVTFYGAAIGKPVIIGSSGSDELVPGTPIQTLVEVAPHLDSSTPLREQVVAARLSSFAWLAERAVAYPGAALRRMREEIYALLHLPVPAAEPRRTRVRIASVAAEALEPALAVYVTAGQQTDRLTFQLRRVAASVLPEDGEAVHHVVASERENDERLLETAAVVVAVAVTPEAETSQSPVDLLRILDRYPGCRVAVASDGRTIHLSARGGHAFAIDHDHDHDLETSIAGSIVYAAICAGVIERLVAHGAHVTVGERQWQLRITTEAERPLEQ